MLAITALSSSCNTGDGADALSLQLPQKIGQFVAGAEVLAAVGPAVGVEVEDDLEDALPAPP